MEIELTVRGLDRAITYLDLTNEIPEAVNGVLEEGVNELIDYAKEIVPVRTGTLRGSLRILEVGDMSVKFGSELPYSGWVEYGTSRMEPQPYYRPAMDEYAPKIAPSIKNAILRLLGRL